MNPRFPTSRSHHSMLTGIAIGICMLVLFAPTIRAAEIEGVAFEDEIRVSPDRSILLRLNGMGLLRYRVVFRGYVAALYLPDRISEKRVLQNVPRRLELSYFWSIGAKDFGDAANQLLQRNLSASEFEAIRPRLATFHRAYRDVSPNDRYSLTYLPDVGTELRLNEELLVSVPGEDFASAYFGIWLGDQPLDRALRDELLGAR